MMKRTLILLASMGVAAMTARAETEIRVDDMSDLSVWRDNADGGSAPDILPAPPEAGMAGMRLLYRNGTSGWGNVVRPLAVDPADNALRFTLKVLAAEAGAAMHVWLFEADGDAYLVRVETGAGQLTDRVGAEAVDVTVPFSTLSYQPRGDGTRQFLTINRVLLGCNFADFDVVVGNLRLVRSAVRDAALPRTERLELRRGASGTVAILAEPTVPRQAGHADPDRLRALLEADGYGVTAIRAGDLCDAAVLDPSVLDVLVLPNAPFFPRAAADTFKAYLKGGGSFLSLGGYALDDLSIRTATGWARHDPAITAADMDRQTGPGTALNTRFGVPGDTMRLDPEQIGVFDPSYLLRNVVSIRGPGLPGGLSSDWSAPVAVEGFAAVGLTGSNSPVFPDVYGRRIPLLEAADRFGRSRGPVGSIVHDTAGPYAGSSRAFFGVTNTDLFAGGFPELDRLFVDTVGRLVRPEFLFEPRTDLACYRQGEAVRLSVRCRVSGPADGVRVVFRIDGVPAGEAAPVDGLAEAVRAAGAFDRDFCRVTAELVRDGEVRDRVETAFVVWDEGTLASGPSLALRGNYLDFRGVPTFLTGVNQTGIMWYSLNEDPLVWQRDFEKMNDCGQNIIRILHFSPFCRPREQSPQRATPLDLANRPLETQRKTDAIVQLAQKYNVVVFLTLHDWMGCALTDEELAAQRDWNRFWADRYRDVPGIMYDIQNEPSVELPPERGDLRELAAVFVSENDPAGGAAVAPGEVDLAAKPSGWGDVRGALLDRFRVTELFNRWTAANAAGVRDADPDALVTVGHLQHLPAADRVLGAENLDFSNTHFYGSIEQLRGYLKLMDRRFEGKSLSLGEFGSREAHTARNQGVIGDPAEKSVLYYLSVGHYALGMGASFIANWDWKDFPDCVFPWGINHADLVSKPVLEAYRNMALLFRAVEPVYRDPEVYLLVPDSNRFGSSFGDVHGAVLRAIDGLFGSRVPFGLINEEALEQLPEAARVLVWPVPYCPTDATFERVLGFVRAGGTLYVSGDVRFAATRLPERLGRLAELGFAGDLPAPEAPGSASADSLPAVPEWARCGAGAVCRVPRPVEFSGGTDLAGLYSAVIARAAVTPLRVTPADSRLHAFAVPSRTGRAFVFFNGTGARQTVRIEDPGLASPVSLELAAGHPGLLLADADGALVGVVAQGSVRAGDRVVCGMTGNAGLLSLDGGSLVASAEVLILPFGSGDVTLSRDGGVPSEICTAEVRAGSLRVLETVVAAGGDSVEIRIPADSAFDLRCLRPAARAAAVAARVEDLLTRGQ